MLAGALLVLVLASGCTPTPVPTPTPTGFASEEEAFRAAEETYRAYVDALNQVDLADPATFEPVFAWTTGEFNQAERKSLTQMAAERWTVGGESRITRIDPVSASPPLGDVEIGVCVDVSTVMLVDASGVSQVSSNRPNVQSTVVTLTADEDAPNGLLIQDVTGQVLDKPC